MWQSHISIHGAQTLNLNGCMTLVQIWPRINMYTTEHESCERHHMIMVHAIVLIMQSWNLFNLNSNQEGLILYKLYNFWIVFNMPVWINLNVEPSFRRFDIWIFFYISNGTSSTVQNRIILYTCRVYGRTGHAVNPEYWTLNFLPADPESLLTQ